jgi:hypothetical protein
VEGSVCGIIRALYRNLPARAKHQSECSVSRWGFEREPSDRRLDRARNENKCVHGYDLSITRSCCTPCIETSLNSNVDAPDGLGIGCTTLSPPPPAADSWISSKFLNMAPVEAQLRHLYNRPSIQEWLEIQRDISLTAQCVILLFPPQRYSILRLYSLWLHKTVHGRHKASSFSTLTN